MLTPYYEEDGITIYHGDCREILPHILTVDLVLTDPPYGVGFRYDSYVDSDENFSTQVLCTIHQLIRTYNTAVCMSMRQMWQLPTARWVLCWHKPGSVRRSRVGGWSIWEPVFLYGDGWKFANDAITLPDCVNHDSDNTHPCPKPLKLFRWILSHHQGVRILDPFMGSGTTLVAAKELGRQAIGIEISEAYCELAVKRLRQGVLALEVD